MQTLVAGTDFSKPANNAVEYAAQLARYFSARLVIANAFQMPLQGYNSLSPLNMVSELQRYSEDQLSLIRDNLISRSYDFGIETYSVLGSAASVMKDTLNRYGADLLVMGMTGEGSLLKEKLIGSTSTSVAKDSKVPVLIIPEGVSYKPVRRISLACDMETMEESTLLYAARYFAKLFDAELELVTVQASEKEEAWNKSGAYSEIEKRLGTVKHKQVFLKENNVSTALEYYFKFHDTDLVIVNPQKHKFMAQLFSGSVTRHLAFHSQKPLLIIH